MDVSDRCIVGSESESDWAEVGLGAAGLVIIQMKSNVYLVIHTEALEIGEMNIC